MYVRRKVIKGHTYYYLVRSERHGATVRQTVVRYLGKQPMVPASPATEAVPAPSLPDKAIPTVSIPELGGASIERPVANAVRALLAEDPISSGFHGALNQRWTIVCDDELSDRAIRAAHAVGLEVTTREAPKGTGRILTDISLTRVSVMQLDEATRVFDAFADVLAGGRTMLPSTYHPSPMIPESRRFTGKAFRAESGLLLKGQTAQDIVDFEADELAFSVKRRNFGR